MAVLCILTGEKLTSEGEMLARRHRSTAHVGRYECVLCSRSRGAFFASAQIPLIASRLKYHSLSVCPRCNLSDGFKDCVRSRADVATQRKRPRRREMIIRHTWTKRPRSGSRHSPVNRCHASQPTGPQLRQERMAIRSRITDDNDPLRTWVDATTAARKANARQALAKSLSAAASHYWSRINV
jgi:hypothetical protein